jgi:hypothetical protein
MQIRTKKDNLVVSLLCVLVLCVSPIYFFYHLQEDPIQPFAFEVSVHERRNKKKFRTPNGSDPCLE